MRIKVSDYIANFFLEHNINQVFTVVGGGAMHLNDSFGHNPKYHCIYNHHEQASAIAAEAYARINNTPAICCVTSGPGAINALNGVAGAYQDSIPMIVLSGQAKRELTTRYTGTQVRTLGNQEFDIVSALSNMTKYATMIVDAKQIRYELEKMLYLATTGRPGPTWLDIPLDVQGSYVETEELKGYDVEQKDEDANGDLIRDVIEHLMQAERPVIYAGNGIRIAGAVQELHEFAAKAQVPIVTCWDSVDLIGTDNPLFVGRGGTMGDRAGNFAVQNSDFLLCIGSRLNIYQVGYNKETWARAAYVVDVDVDEAELSKPTIRVDMPVCMDAKVFLQQALKLVATTQREQWLKKCHEWKNRYPVVQKKHYETDGLTNIYAFIGSLSKKLGADSLTVVANGSASVVGSQGYYISEGSRFIMNCGLSSMGYDLPAAIGATVGATGRTNYICIAGDGSIQMNIQELQTIVTNKLPIKIFVINNGGYHQIRLTQNNIFHNGLVGVGPESKDLGFPDFEKLSSAYGIPYYSISSNQELDNILDDVLAVDGYVLCEVICSTDQIFEPKSATKKLEDGSLFSPPLEDLAPFLPREELIKNMIIPVLEETK